MFSPNREKASNAVLELRTESSYLGHIGADFAWKKMFLYYMDFVQGLQVRVTKYPNFRVLERKNTGLSI